MELEQILAILQNRLLHNQRQRDIAVQRGDLDEVARLDADTGITQASLATVQAAATAAAPAA